jgi:hypothetical protein
VWRSYITSLLTRNDFWKSLNLHVPVTLGVLLRMVFEFTGLYVLEAHRRTRTMGLRMSLFDSTAWTWGTEHGKPLSWPLIIQQPRGEGGGYRKQTHRPAEHAAEFKYHFVCIMWTSYCVDSAERATLVYTALFFGIMWTLCNVDSGFGKEGSSTF